MTSPETPRSRPEGRLIFPNNTLRADDETRQCRLGGQATVFPRDDSIRRRKFFSAAVTHQSDVSQGFPAVASSAFPNALGRNSNSL
jgi:hypothetical protein